MRVMAATILCVFAIVLTTSSSYSEPRARGRVEINKLLLDADANSNQACARFQKDTPLVMGVRSAEVSKLLLEPGAVPTPGVREESMLFRQSHFAQLISDQGGERLEDENDIGGALIRYATQGDAKQVQRILKKDAGKNISEDERRMVLTQAVEKGHADVVRVLLDAGIDLKKMLEPGTCLLMEACRKGRADIVKLLLDKGAPANDGSALAAAAGGSYLPGQGGGHLDVVKLLVERGADVNAESDDCLDPSGDFSVTALQVAVREGHVELVRYLLEKGADPKAEMTYAGNPEAGGNSAITFAARNGHTEMLKLILDKGADVNRPTTDGETALMAACSGDHLETAKFLLGRGANVNARCKEGNTALFYALPNVALVKLLIEKGADPTIKNGEGLTVLDIARDKHHNELITIFQAAEPKKTPGPKTK